MLAFTSGTQPSPRGGLMTPASTGLASDHILLIWMVSHPSHKYLTQRAETQPGAGGSHTHPHFGVC